MGKDNVILKVSNLRVRVDGKEILKDVSFELKRGEVLVLFGPNGVGKSTLLKVLMGVGSYEVEGKVIFKGRDLLSLSPDERAKLGLGLAFQSMPKFKGLILYNLAKNIANRFGVKENRIHELAEYLGISDLLSREVGKGFSGGQTKRAELLLTLLQEPELIMVDEPDSGVDVDGVKRIGMVLNDYLEREKPIYQRTRSGILITHSGAIMDWVKADIGMVIVNGKGMCYQSPNSILRMIHLRGYEECFRCFKLSRSLEECLEEFARSISMEVKANAR